MSPSFNVKMFELHIEAFQFYKNILVFALAGRCLILTSTGLYEDALIGVKGLYV
jgi:hypothetical protein